MDGVVHAGRTLEGVAARAKLAQTVARMAEPSAEAILEAARDFIDTPRAIETCIGALVAAAGSDPFFRPPLRSVSSAIRSGLVLFEVPELALLLATVTPDDLAAKRTLAEGPSSINFTGERTLLHFIDAGGASLSFWEAPPWDEGFSSVGAEPCRFVARREISNGETIAVDGRHEGFVIEQLRSTMVYLQAVTRVGGGALNREYDSKSLAFVGASSTDDAASRTELLLTLLRDMERADAVPLFVRAFEEGAFHTRWHAMRELLALDAEAALPHLRRMAAADPHPEVRAAAGQTLALFYPDEAASAAEVSCHA